MVPRPAKTDSPRSTPIDASLERWRKRPLRPRTSKSQPTSSYWILDRSREGKIIESLINGLKSWTEAAREASRVGS